MNTEEKTKEAEGSELKLTQEGTVAKEVEATANKQPVKEEKQKHEEPAKNLPDNSDMAKAAAAAKGPSGPGSLPQGSKSPQTTAQKGTGNPPYPVKEPEKKEEKAKSYPATKNVTKAELKKLLNAKGKVQTRPDGYFLIEGGTKLIVQE